MLTSVFFSQNRVVMPNGATSQSENLRAQYFTALTVATLATSISLGIAAYTGWQRGGLFVERVMAIMLGSVAVLYLHLLPMGWRMLRVPARIFAFSMWGISVVVVLYGQATFFMVSHQHAGNERAAMVPVTIMSSDTGLSSGRGLAEIAQDIAKVKGYLAIANVRRCAGGCPALTVRRTILAAQLAALNTETDEVKRREAEEDRRNEQSDRNEALRATLRADPVALAVASWFGATESGLELMLAVSCAVVLEGTAIIGWLLVSVASERKVVAFDRGSANSDRSGSCEIVAAGRKVAMLGRDAIAPDPALAIDESAHSLVTSNEDLLLKKIHDAVVAGQFKPTQVSIRKFLRCGQLKAGSLNRQYLAQFGSVSG